MIRLYIIYFFIAWIGIIGMVSCDNRSKQSFEHSQYFLTIGSHTAWVEVANNNSKRTMGLMYRESLPKDTGMLFIYETAEILSFWMKNTHIPLSIAFIAKDGNITDILDMQVYDGSPDHLLPRYASSKPVNYALEMRQGWFKEKNIQAGDKVEFSPNLTTITKKVR